MKTPMCAVKTCLLRALPNDQFCCLHLNAVLAQSVAADIKGNTCGRCHRAIHPQDFVSRTMLQIKHKRAGGATSFAWQHAFCTRPPATGPSKAARKKAPKPLFADLDR